jgi:hypothetical protein
MPGTLLYAAPATVLPQALWAAFAPTDTWPTVLNTYADGNYQARSDGSQARRAWRLTRRLTFAQWILLEAFWVARRGGYDSFWFYPLFADYDATGASTVGRYTVRFDGQFSTTFQLGRSNAQLALIELPEIAAS